MSNLKREYEIQKIILQGLCERSPGSVPWLIIGKPRTFLGYEFARYAIESIDPEVVTNQLRKLQLDFFVLCLGFQPELPLLPDYEFAPEVLAIRDTWQQRKTYEKYEHLPKSDTSQRNNIKYLRFRQYKCCELPNNKEASKRIGWNFEWSLILRYLAAEKAVREWGAIPK